MEKKERRTNKCRILDDRRHHFDSDYTEQQRRTMPNRRRLKDRRKSE
jgi:hypothetical protein